MTTGKVADKKLFWVQIPGVYAGKQYVQREVGRFGDFVIPKKLKQLVRTGHLVSVTKREDVEICPCCQQAFMRANSVEISQDARRAVVDQMMAGTLESEKLIPDELAGLKRLGRFLVGKFRDL